MKITLELERPVAYYPQLARALGSPEAAIYIQQLYYWSDKGSRLDGWIYKTKEEIEAETALTRDQQDRVRKKMESLGIIEVKLMKANGSPTLHYKLVTTALQQLLISGNSDSRETRYSKSGKPAILLTKTTTETTPDTKVSGASPGKSDPAGLINSTDDGVDGELVDGELLTVPPAVDDLTTNKIRPSMGREDISDVISFFEGQFGLKLKRLKQQRFAANRLIGRYGQDTVDRAIKAAALVRDEEYAPQILNLEDLWAKWDKLESFYRKKKTEQGRVTVLGDE